MKGLDLILNASGIEKEEVTTLTLSFEHEKTSESSVITDEMLSVLTDEDEKGTKPETEINYISLVEALQSMTSRKTTESTSTETITTTPTTQIMAATTGEERQVFTAEVEKRNEPMEFLNIALICTCFLLICICIILIFFIYKSNKRHIEKIFKMSNMSKILFPPSNQARQIQVGILKESNSQRRNQERNPIVEGGFAWSSLVNYSKQLHLRTMKPAGLPPIQKTTNRMMRTKMKGEAMVAGCQSSLPSVS